MIKNVHVKESCIAMEDIKKGNRVVLDYFGRIYKYKNICPKCNDKGTVPESGDPFYSMNPINETCECVMDQENKETL